MSLRLYMHPLAAYCHKGLIALYENGTPFHPHLVDLADDRQRAEFYALWPIGKFPVLDDRSRGCLVPESSIIIEYLARHYPGQVALVPADEDDAREVRFRDRFFDLYVMDPTQKVITDRLRPPGEHDRFGVAQARDKLRAALDLIEHEFVRDNGKRLWAAGHRYSMADCAASPALFYANFVIPLEDDHPQTAAYLLRLMERPSFARVLREAQPYLHMVPREPAEA
ncbi:glutathione S-transferase [Dyella jiangningensis]|uniref:glutathione S-transferase family protein n=1 Tax=Dyella sp. AtDHG13 TaxID=1938897 RepID=UPI000890C83B|nr:glutathione S-transferase family protein [Dyella sp. AtDHG13]PXV59095.1 glutathione S-transferase [Dyella sp. AtDHG13]SDK21709.1 glutathione S-transferase [Dyella jiangningensis]